MNEQSGSERHDRKVTETEINPGKYVTIIEFPVQDGGRRTITSTVTVFEGWTLDRVKQFVQNDIGSIGMHNFGLIVDETGTAEIEVSLADYKIYAPHADNEIVHSFTYRVDHEGHKQ